MKQPWKSRNAEQVNDNSPDDEVAKRENREPDHAYSPDNEAATEE